MNIEPIKISKINKNRLDIFLLSTRNPLINFIVKEVEYYSNDDASILGIILFDYTDEDFNYVLIVRDENKQFRAIETKTDFKYIDDARNTLINSMKWKTSQELRMVPQGISKKGIKLFNIVVPDSKLHPYFKRLSEDSHFIPSKKTLIEISNHFEDIDGNFIEQFQSINGFDARIWEIYLFAVFIELNFEVNRSYSRPDFLIKKGEIEIGIEAVVVSRKNDNPPTYLNLKPLKAPYQIKNDLENDAQLRFGSTLYSKLKKDYWKLPNIQGKAFIIAIADFHDTASMTWTSPALTEYLYGLKVKVKKTKSGEDYVYMEKAKPYLKESGIEIESGFFFQEGAENISGILFSSTGTLSKFTRMGIQAEFGIKNQVVRRFGDIYNSDPNSIDPIPFTYIVSEDSYEKWNEGVNLFHNPNAIHPIPMELFDHIAHHKLIDGEICSWLPEFHPISSMDVNSVIRE